MNLMVAINTSLTSTAPPATSAVLAGYTIVSVVDDLGSSQNATVSLCLNGHFGKLPVMYGGATRQ